MAAPGSTPHFLNIDHFRYELVRIKGEGNNWIAKRAPTVEVSGKLRIASLGHIWWLYLYLCIFLPFVHYPIFGGYIYIYVYFCHLYITGKYTEDLLGWT